MNIGFILKNHVFIKSVQIKYCGYVSHTQMNTERIFYMLWKKNIIISFNDLLLDTIQ